MSLIDPLLPTIEHFGLFGYWFALLIALLESLAFIGLIIPGTLIIVFMGFLALQGFFDISDLIWFAATGAVLGDLISYRLGKKGENILTKNKFFLKQFYLKKGKEFFKKHGGKSLFFGRFIGATRPIIPFVAGLTGMRLKYFLILDILSASLWAFAYLLLGYFFGHAWRLIQGWSSKVAIFIAIVVLLVYGVYFFERFVITKGKQLLGLFKSIGSSVWQALSVNPDIRKFLDGHPRFHRFIKHRTSRKKFTGFAFSLIAIAFIYILSLFFGIVSDVITSDLITEADIRIENIFYIFRSPELIKIFSWITLLGNWQLILSGTVLLALFLWISKKYYHSVIACLVVSGSFLFGYLGKWLIHRPRPETAYYLYDTYSFPSLHATAAMTLYGFIAYYLFIGTKSWKKKIDLLFLNSLLILAIGLSRMYLGVHFLSDVIAGYLLGLLWLLMGITAIGWLNQKSSNVKKNQTIRTQSILGASFLAIFIVFYGFFSAYYHPEINVIREVKKPTIITDNMLAPFQDASHPLPKYSESVIGIKHEPLNIIIIADNDETFITAFEKAGWFLADKPDFHSLSKTAHAFLYNISYPHAPITPLFWNRAVNDFGFEKPTPADNVAERHHSRFWETDLRTPDHKKVYVGTASFDAGVKWFITHRIKPDIDTEAALLVDDLKNAEVVKRTEKKPFVSPILSVNAFGDSFFTNGDVNIVYLEN